MKAERCDVRIVLEMTQSRNFGYSNNNNTDGNRGNRRARTIHAACVQRAVPSAREVNAVRFRVLAARQKLPTTRICCGTR